MSAVIPYAVGAVGLIAIGLHGFLARRDVLRRVLALNVMGGGVFLLLIVLALPRGGGDAEALDPVPHALVLTGLVVAVSSTALALALAGRLGAASGRATLPEDRRTGDASGKAP